MRINLVTPFAEKDEAKALGDAGMQPKSGGTSLMLLTSHHLRAGVRSLPRLRTSKNSWRLKSTLTTGEFANKVGNEVLLPM
jgi:hypothetical protein